jgi:hypothetical protein
MDSLGEVASSVCGEVELALSKDGAAIISTIEE